MIPKAILLHRHLLARLGLGRHRRWPGKAVGSRTVPRVLLGMVCLVAATLAPAALWAQEVEVEEAMSREYTIKAAFLYNFGRYVRWPDSSLPKPDTPFVIGILGKDPFGQILDMIAKEKNIEGRKVIVRRFATLDQYTPCQILFVARSIEPAKQLEVIQRLRGTPVLLVGETPAFAERGGAMNFFVEENKIRFEINAQAAERAQLKISAKLRPLGVEKSEAKAAGSSSSGTSTTTTGEGPSEGQTP